MDNSPASDQALLIANLISERSLGSWVNLEIGLICLEPKTEQNSGSFHVLNSCMFFIEHLGLVLCISWFIASA